MHKATDIKQNQSQPDERGNWLQVSLLEHIQHAVIATDLDGKILGWNSFAEKIYGWSEAEVLNKPLSDLLQAPELLFATNDVLLNPLDKKVWSGECIVRRKDGRKAEVSSQMWVYPDAAGEPAGVLTISVDISDQKNSERVLRQHDQLLQSVLQSISSHVTVIDKEGNILYISDSWPEFVTMQGIEKSKVKVGVNYLDICQEAIKQDPSVEKILYAINIVLSGKATSMSYECELIFETKSSWFLMKVDAMPRSIGGAVISYTDIMDKVRMEEKLRKSEAQLRHSQKMEAIGRLAGGIAHDFNNLLTAIISYTDIIKNKLEQKDPLRAYSEEVLKASSRAANLTRQLLTFSRNLPMQPVIMDLNDVISNILKLLKRVIGEDINLVTKLEPRLDKVMADRGQIEQVLLNLAVNARDAMPSGGILTIETGNVEVHKNHELIANGLEPGKYIVVAISDTGMGMDKEIQSHIFEPFFTTKEQGKGTGLGLSTVYGIISQSGGIIEVRSHPGQGSTFEIYLPVEFSNEPVREPENRQQVFDQNNETILLVEDDEFVRDISKLVLSQRGYKLLVAENGEEAIKLSLSYPDPIDLIVTDVIMPNIGGFEVVDKIHKQRSDLKVLFVSGYTGQEIGLQEVANSKYDLLHKPFTPTQLLLKVREILDESRHS